MSSELFKEQLAKRLEDAADKMTASFVSVVQQSLTTCVVCDHWNQTGETCMKFQNQRPPARVIAFGCPAFENEVPF